MSLPRKKTKVRRYRTRRYLIELPSCVECCLAKTKTCWRGRRDDRKEGLPLAVLCTPTSYTSQSVHALAILKP